MGREVVSLTLRGVKEAERDRRGVRFPCEQGG
jgi:hypothetical protein